MFNLVYTRSSKEIDDLKFNHCFGKPICVEELLLHKKMPPRRDYSKANHDEIRAKLNEIDWAVEFSDKDVNECYEIFLKLHEKSIEESVPKFIYKTEDER